MNELYKNTATEVVDLLKRKIISPLEVVEHSISRIDTIDKHVNALPIRCFERAIKQAKCVKNISTNPDKYLYGLPIVVKDYNDVSGVRTTYGSPIYSDYVPIESDATIAHLEQNGAIPIAKSNVPEWAGGHTFNPVFGTTRNPWDTNLSAGGSSGGSAVALATGMAWLATGNDLGGSLRTPAAFNGVVGLRPGPGLIPRGKRLQPFDTLWVEGPMARNISDLALMLDAGVGHVKEDPLSFSNAGLLYTSSLRNKGDAKRVAFSKDLNVVNVSRELADITEISCKKLNHMGIEITDEVPDFSGTLDAFQTLRAVLLGTMMGPLLYEHRDRIAPEIVKNVEMGFKVTPQSIFEAERIRWQLFQRMIQFFETHDYLICPASSISPFPVEQRYVTEIDGQPCKTYIDWFSITFALTMTSCPVLSLPCGFTKKGLPVGLQIVGRPRGEAELLRDASRMEEIFDVAHFLPINPQTSQ